MTGSLPLYPPAGKLCSGWKPAPATYSEICKQTLALSIPDSTGSFKLHSMTNPTAAAALPDPTLPMLMPMPFVPRSPSPRMRPPSAVHNKLPSCGHQAAWTKQTLQHMCARHSRLTVSTTALTDYNDLDRLARPVLQDVLESVPMLKATEVHSQWRAACNSIPRCQQHAQVFPKNKEEMHIISIVQLTCRYGRTSDRPASGRGLAD